MIITYFGRGVHHGEESDSVFFFRDRMDGILFPVYRALI